MWLMKKDKNMKAIPQYFHHCVRLFAKLHDVLFYLKKRMNVCKPINKCVVALVLFLWGVPLWSQVKADFSFDIPSGCSPVNVSFTNLSTPVQGATFYWEFGNGNVSTALNPQTTYHAVGSYSVKLTITYNNQTDVITKEDCITVHPNPQASFQPTGATEGCSPLITAFQNLSSDPAGSELSYIWSFGDGYSSSDKEPSHQYLAGGDFDVTLMVTNEFRCVNSYTSSTKISVYKPIAKFGVDQSSSCTGNLLAKFNNLSEGGNQLTYEWNFGDGQTSSDPNPVHQFESTGSYNVQLTAIHPFGCSSTLMLNKLINIVKTKAVMTASKDTVCPNQKIDFTSLSENANSFTWKWGDGTSDHFKFASKTYPVAGDFQVWLIATNGVCTDSVMKKINIEHVAADFLPDESFICQLPATIDYQNKSINAVEYNWRFGNGQTSTSPTPSIIIPDDIQLTDGKKWLPDTLIVTSKHGCKSQKIIPQSVQIWIPQVKMIPGEGGDPKKLKGCIPMSLSFTDNTSYSTPQDNIVSRKWQLSNGTQIETNAFDVNITAAGIYPVNLTITTQLGCVHSASEKISAGIHVTPDFNVLGSKDVCASTPVDFEITSPEKSLLSGVSWDFGDGDEDPMQITPHYYIKTGSMDVTLTVFNNGCGSTITKPNAVNILGPIVNIKKIVDCKNAFHYEFIADVQDATSYTWDFGDGTTPESNIVNPHHYYSTKDKYKVTLTSVNTTNGCEFKVFAEANIKDSKATIANLSGLPCPASAMQFSGDNSIDASPFVVGSDVFKYLWIHQETGKTLFSDVPVEFRFNTKGNHHLQLIVKDSNGCADTSTQVIEIFQPTAVFDANYIGGCLPISYAFLDQSVSQNPITQWRWNFGDNSTSLLQNPTHDFNDFGKYNISLEVTDAIGCKHSSTLNQFIQANKPDASFKAVDSTLCVGDQTQFICTSQSNVVSYWWEFSDGFTSSLPQPTRQFDVLENISVQLSIVDDHNCHASLTKTEYIQTQNFPVADFTADILASNCYPFVVQFNDLSVTGSQSSWKWDFGNNNQSLIQHPFFIYNRPGKHDVSLITYSSFGCSDTIKKAGYVNVGGPYATINVNDTICRNSDILFQATDVLNVFDFKWDFGDGYAGTGNNVTHRFDNAGFIHPVLFLRANEENTCNKAIIDTLYILEQTANFTFDSQMGCVPLSSQFKNLSTNSTSWLWDFGDGNVSSIKEPIHQFNKPGNYQVSLKAMHDLGCSETFTQGTFEVFPLPDISINPDTVICQGDVATLTATGGVTYNWQPANLLSTPSLSNTEAKPGQSTRFKVDVTDLNHCLDSAFVNVWVQLPLEVNLRDTSIIIGETFRPDIFDPAVETYNWTPSLNVSCTYCSDPMLSPLETTLYTIAVTDTSNCFTTQHPFLLTVEKKYSVDLPNTFTPNNDGINDRVFVKGWGIKELISFQIHNRFGQLVYDSTQIEEGWDGNFKGKPLPIETYSFKVSVRTYENTILSKTGTIKIIR
jgi:gliding motility-associated-like protein